MLRATTVGSRGRWRRTRRVLLAIGAGFLVVAATLVVVAATVDWNRLKPLITSNAAGRIGRELEIRGNLAVDLSLHPRIVVEDVWLENADWASSPELLAIERIDARIDLLDLLRGRLVFHELELERPRIALEKTADGKVNWDLAPDSVAEVAADAAVPDERREFPVLEKLVVRDGVLVFRSEGERPIELMLDHASGHGDRRELAFEGAGRYQDRALRFAIVGGPIGALHDTGEPYPVSLVVDVDAEVEDELPALEARLKGSFVEPLALEGSDVRLKVSGADLATLYPLLGLPFPSTPPYELRGRLRHFGSRWEFEAFDGRLGDSDLSGDLEVVTDGERPKMTARLHSNKLDFDDLAGLVGATPDVEETASAAQAAEAERKRDEDSVFPDEPIKLDRVRAMDVDVDLEAAHVEAPDLPIWDLTLSIDVVDGVVRVSPARFGVGGRDGRVDLYATIYADRTPVRADVDLRARRVRLAALMHETGFAKQSGGTIGGRVEISATGRSVREMAGTIDGKGFFAIAGGQISHLLVEVVGIDVFEALGVAIAEPEDSVEIRCMIADVVAEDGRVKANTLILDTSDTNILGRGSIDLEREIADIVLEPHPKDVSLLSLRAPVRIEGPLGDLSVRPDPAGLGPGGKVEKVLSFLLTPVLGLLHPLDLALGDDSPCAELIAGAERAHDAQVEDER